MRCHVPHALRKGCDLNLNPARVVPVVGEGLTDGTQGMAVTAVLILVSRFSVTRICAWRKTVKITP